MDAYWVGQWSKDELNWYNLPNSFQVWKPIKKILISYSLKLPLHVTSLSSFLLFSSSSVSSTSSSVFFSFYPSRSLPCCLSPSKILPYNILCPAVILLPFHAFFLMCYIANTSRKVCLSMFGKTFFKPGANKIRGKWFSYSLLLLNLQKFFLIFNLMRNYIGRCCQRHKNYWGNLLGKNPRSIFVPE